MNKTRIAELRQERGWTQERLAAESGVGLRTVQRIESGNDASLETLSLVAGSLRVSVRDLFSVIEDSALDSRVESYEARAEEQQDSRDRVCSASWWLYVGVGIVVTLWPLFGGGSNFLFVLIAYWGGGYFVLMAVRSLFLEPMLDRKYPLSRNTHERRSSRQAAQPVAIMRERYADSKEN